MVPAPQAALLVAEIVAESRQSRQIVAESRQKRRIIAGAVELRRICAWGRPDVGVNHVALDRACDGLPASVKTRRIPMSQLEQSEGEVAK